MGIKNGNFVRKLEYFLTKKCSCDSCELKTLTGIWKNLYILSKETIIDILLTKGQEKEENAIIVLQLLNTFDRATVAQRYQELHKEKIWY